MRANKGERRAIEAMLSAGTKGWTVRLHTELPIGCGEIGGRTSHIYLVDTATDTHFSASIKPDRLSALFEICKIEAICHDHIIGDLWTVLYRLGKVGPEQEVMNELMILAAATFNDTKTQEIALCQPDGHAGHWIVILYRTQSGTLLDRPVYIKQESTKGNLMHLADLQKITRQVVSGDINSGTSIGKMIQLDGGAILHKKYC
jgi:hypothetical protein